MPRNRCPHCERRLPYAGRRCVHCGWCVGEAALGPGEGVAWWRRRRLWTAITAGMLFVGVALAYRNAPELADWYASFAAENLPTGASSLALTDTDSGAFFYCARQVARRMNGEYSVETFPSREESELTPLGDGRYRIESFVDETREDGRRVRYSFVCRVAFDQGRWILEDLDLSQRFATEEGAGPALAARER